MASACGACWAAVLAVLAVAVGLALRAASAARPTTTCRRAKVDVVLTRRLLLSCNRPPPIAFLGSSFPEQYSALLCRPCQIALDGAQCHRQLCVLDFALDWQTLLDLGLNDRQGLIYAWPVVP